MIILILNYDINFYYYFYKNNKISYFFTYFYNKINISKLKIIYDNFNFKLYFNVYYLV